MSQILNTTPETLGTGAIVKFNSSCPVIATLIKGDARLGMGSVSGKTTFTVVTPGDYEFKATCDCGASYTVMYAGEVDPSTAECCVNPLTNPAGELLGIEIGGDEFFSPATSDPVTYTWAETNPVDGDGVVEWTGTPSDGSTPQVITLTEPTVDSDTVFTGMTVDPLTGIVTQTFEDADGNPLPNQTADLSALISTDHPVLAGAGSTTVAFDAASNTWTISSAATADTDTSVVIVNNADGSQSLQNVDINGNNVGAAVALTDANNISQHVSLNQPNSPIKITETAAGVFEHDYDLSATPDTSNAPDYSYRQAVEGSDGKEYVLQSGSRWREHHDGTVTIFGSTSISSAQLDSWVDVPLPITLNGSITKVNTSVTLTDVAAVAQPVGPVPSQLLATMGNNLSWSYSDVNDDSSFRVAAKLSDPATSTDGPDSISWKLSTTLGVLK